RERKDIIALNSRPCANFDERCHRSMSEQGTNVMAQLSQPAVAATAADSISLATVLAPRRPLSRDSTLMPLYLELIRSGAKTVEGRIRAGDHVGPNRTYYNC
ncbi:hypothetical protein Vretimale_12533, partial [Volvox reticuliferus]